MLRATGDHTRRPRPEALGGDSEADGLIIGTNATPKAKTARADEMRHTET